MGTYYVRYRSQAPYDQAGYGMMRAAMRGCRLCFRVCWRLPDLVILSLHILYRFYCVICTSARFHEPLCVHVRHPHGPSLHISCMRYLYIRPISRTSVRMSECVKRVTRSEYFGNFLLLSRVSSAALIVHSVVCMSVILYGRDSFCTVVRGRNLVVRRLYLVRVI